MAAAVCMHICADIAVQFDAFFLHHSPFRLSRCVDFFRPPNERAAAGANFPFVYRAARAKVKGDGCGGGVGGAPQDFSLCTRVQSRAKKSTTVCVTKRSTQTFVL